MRMVGVGWRVERWLNFAGLLRVVACWDEQSG